MITIKSLSSLSNALADRLAMTDSGRPAVCPNGVPPTPPAAAVLPAPIGSGDPARVPSRPSSRKRRRLHLNWTSKPAARPAIAQPKTAWFAAIKNSGAPTSQTPRFIDVRDAHRAALRQALLASTRKAD